LIAIEEGPGAQLSDGLPGPEPLAMQSDILGATALGVNTMLCLSGDHPKFGDHPMSLWGARHRQHPAYRYGQK
jgi:hypothetical protein